MEQAGGFTSDERQKLRTMMVDHSRIMLTVFGDGNGNKGMLSRIDSHFIRDEVEREQREKTDTRRSRIHFAILGAFFALLTGILIAVLQMWASGHKIVSVNTSETTPHQIDASAVPTHY